MKLFIIEAPGKIKYLKGVLKKHYSDIDVGATFGQIFDTPNDKLGVVFPSLKEDKYLRNPKVIDELSPKVEEAEHIYLMTDYDEIGEQISRDFIELFNLKNNYSRVYLNSFSEKEIINKIELCQDKDISVPVAKTSDAKRIINKVIGYEIPTNGFEKSLPIGSIISPLIYQLNNPNNIVGNIITYMSLNGRPFKLKAHYPKKSMKHVDEIKDIMENILKRTFEDKKNLVENKENISDAFSYLNYYDLLNVLSDKYSLKDAQELCQKSYQSGNISYFRTDSRKKPDASLEHLKEKYGKLESFELDEADEDELENIKNSISDSFQEPHSSIYPEKNTVNVFDDIDFISENKEVAYFVEKMFLLSKTKVDAEKIKIKAKILKAEKERLESLGVSYNDSFELVKIKTKSSSFERYYDPDISKTDFIHKRKINGVFNKEFSKELYCLKELYSLGISKPSTMVGHSIKASKYIEDDFSLNKKARIAIQVINDRLPMLLDIKKVKEMHDILEQSETLESKVRGAMDAIGIESENYFDQDMHKEFRPKSNDLTKNNTSLRTKGVEL